MAIEISLGADGNISLALPRHTVSIPLNLQGLALLRHILQANAVGPARVSEPGNPTQFDVDAFFKSGAGAKMLVEKRKPRFSVVEGLDIDDLI